VYATANEAPPNLVPQLSVGWKGCGAMLIWTAGG
jgi:hypothetical protein